MALEHGGARGRSRCARAALGERKGARRRLGTAVGDRGREQGARRRRLGVQASGGVSVGERRRVVAARRRVRSGGGVRWEESGETEKERETDGPHKTHI